MNQRVAKRLRKEVYGDMATRGRGARITEKGVLVADELRRKFQQAKKNYNKELRAG